MSSPAPLDAPPTPAGSVEEPPPQDDWAGELGALRALDRGHGTDTARTNVYVALGVEAFFIFLLALGWTPRSERSQQHESDNG